MRKTMGQMMGMKITKSFGALLGLGTAIQAQGKR